MSADAPTAEPSAYVAPMDDPRSVDVVLDELIARRVKRTHIHVPLPVAKKGTEFYEHEAKVTIWRIQITESQERLESKIDQMSNSWWRVMWSAIKTCGVGTLGLMQEFMVGSFSLARGALSNENGQLKYLTLIVLGLAVIVYGGALSGWGLELSTGDAPEQPPAIEALALP